MRLTNLYVFIFALTILSASGFAVEYNVIYDDRQEPALLQRQGSTQLGFDPNAFDFLVYDCGGQEVQNALDKLGITYTVRNKSNHVTEQDLIDHDILIVSWKSGSHDDTAGLDPNIIDNGIKGRVILTGHDTDWHAAANRWEQKYAEKFLVQCIKYILDRGNTGLLAHGEPVSGFDWLPVSWGIQVIDKLALEDVTAFTQDGIDSGIFDGLTTDNMSNWLNSFHNVFESYGAGFRPFEMGMVGDANSVITIGAAINPSGFILTKEDNIADGVCLGVDDEIIYTICYQNASDQTFNNVYIIDRLPYGVNYPEGSWTIADPDDPNSLIPPDPFYIPNNHSYLFSIGTLTAGETGCVTLKVTVDQKTEPGISLRNEAEIWAGEILLARAEEYTLVCCDSAAGDPNIIYVDHTAGGNNNGTSWQNAYTDLQDALYRAGNSTCSPGNGFFTVYAAQGSYSPGHSTDDTFALPDGVKMYGGFRTGGTDFEYRNPDLYETVLDGMVDPNGIEQNKTCVTMGDNSLMDGFIIRDSFKHGVLGDRVSFAIENCRIINNGNFGIFTKNGNVNIKCSNISKNVEYGIYHEGQDYAINIENCVISKNKEYGLRTLHSRPTIKNNVVAQNGSSSPGFSGINVTYLTENPILLNNTICYNKKAGVVFFRDDPNSFAYPDVQNNILWLNNNGQGQISGEDPNFIFNNCIYDANDLYGTDYTLDANGNFTGNPGFAYNDPNQYDDPSVEFNPHLAYDSLCIDRGSPHLDYTGQSDIDGEKRVIVRADIGADEVYSYDGNLSADDIYNQLDRNADGILNYGEFVHFSRAWLTHDPCDPAIYDPNYVPEHDYYNDPNHPLYVDIDGGELDRWDAKCNLADTCASRYFIDMDDLMIFCRDGYWLWTACWKESRMNRFPRTVTPQMEGGEAMAIAPMPVSMESPEMTEPQQTETSTEGIAEIIDFVDAAIAGNPPNAEALYDMKIFLEEIITDLQ